LRYSAAVVCMAATAAAIQEGNLRNDHCLFWQTTILMR
jgi:hypothetical protein